MPSRSNLWRCVTILFPLLASGWLNASDRPNIILAMADDQGWGDMAYNGHPLLKTPHLDQMAESGLRFERFYAAAPVCSPTRGSVLTGRHPNRFGCFTWGYSLRPQEITIAEALKRVGYRTGHFGKWHLGSVREDSPVSPGNSGFDEWFSSPNFYENDPWMSHNGKAVKTKGEGSMVTVKAALEFIRSTVEAERPFFALVWFGSPHSPHEALDQDLQLYSDQPDDLRHFLGEITAMDRAMGYLRQQLRELGIAENTLLWYTSDNGAIPLGSTGGLSGRKGDLWEGGIRVPAIVEWPARIAKPGITTVPAGTVDIYPTLLEIAGVTVPNQPPLDGISLLRLIDGRMEKRTEPLGFWVYPAEGQRVPSRALLEELAQEQAVGRVSAAREKPPFETGTLTKAHAETDLPGHAAWIDGEYKLHRIPERDGFQYLLFNISADREEKHDLSAQEAARIKKMKAALGQWQKSVIRSLNGKDYTSKLADIERFAVYEAEFEAAKIYENPYTDLEPTAVLHRPGGAVWRIPLFWDGGKTWKLRVSPDLEGEWQYRVESRDEGLHGSEGSFHCRPSRRKGSIQSMRQYPHHFQHQDGTPFWFMGDTAWALYTDNEDEKHHREAIEKYVKTRAEQGFNVVHAMLMSEAGWGNRGGPPFENITEQRINVSYWEEVDDRLRYLSEHGIIGGLVLAWGNKRDTEPYSWSRFPNQEARRRYARYVAARYSAFDVYFIVSGEWHAEVRARQNEGAERVRHEFIELGEAVEKADPHGRMIAIHPMTDHGSVREFAGTSWASFADYQQNYRQIHERILISRQICLPVVNSEYAYLLRDQNGDGIVDKQNSYTTDDIRQASWDIVMAGGYFVTGFGSTYFGGNRHPGAFDVSAPANDEWEYQVEQIRRFFTRLEWWKLVPTDRLLAAEEERGSDRVRRIEREGRRVTLIQPPERAYWALMEPGNVYLIYVRGLNRPVQLATESVAGEFSVQRFNPRTGEASDLGNRPIDQSFEILPPDQADWVYLLRRVRESRAREIAGSAHPWRLCWCIPKLHPQREIGRLRFNFFPEFELSEGEPARLLSSEARELPRRHPFCVPMPDCFCKHCAGHRYR